jgi:ABC-2 type transport system ATP-binding protein
LWDLILDIKSRGTTIVLTTHYMDEAEELCDRIAIIDTGKILEIKTPDQFIDDLVSSGFEKKKKAKLANLEDVFLSLTGKELREL